MIENGTLLQERYLIQKKIGAGGMGAVYLAVDQRFENHVAIKETFYHEPELAEAFFREARLLNALQHPVLPHVSDYFAENNGYFLVMQFIEGEDLLDTLKRDGAFPFEDVLRWTDQLLDALEYLHSQEPPIIHRDIKPHNLKVTTRGDIRLLDFGLAKINHENTAGAISVFGFSRTYSPLEQIQGTGTDARSDLFALGATAYHLATGKPPADAITRASSIVAGRPDPLVPLLELNPQFPEDAAEVLQMALALNGDNRFISAKAMRKALEHALNPELREKIEAAVPTAGTAPPTIEKRGRKGSRIAASPEFAAFASKRVEDAAPADPEFPPFEAFLPESAPRARPAPPPKAAAKKIETPPADAPDGDHQHEASPANGPAVPPPPKETENAVPAEANETATVVARDHETPKAPVAEPPRPEAERPARETRAKIVTAETIAPAPTVVASPARAAHEPVAAARETASTYRPDNSYLFGNDEREAAAPEKNAGRPAYLTAALWLLLPLLFVAGAALLLFRGGGDASQTAAETAPSAAPSAATNAAPQHQPAPVEASAPDEANAETGRQATEARTRTTSRQRTTTRPTEPAPAERQASTAENAAAEAGREQSSPQPARSRNRERVIVTESVPDIESVFTGRPASERRQTRSNGNDDWIRDEMTEEELREIRRQRRERRRQRRNNPFPF